MTKSSSARPQTANDGYRPLTEGYQPGSQVIQKGYTPPVSHQPPPPRGGSGAMKPNRTTATAPKK